MIRCSQINVSYANKGKRECLDTFCAEALRIVNVYIDILWQNRDVSIRFVNIKVDTWLSARMQQCLGKQASEIVKSQRKRKKKSKPVFKKHTFNLDSRFIEIRQDVNSFDIWFTLGSLGRKIKVILPGKKHRHLNNFLKDGWRLKKKKSVRLRKVGSKYLIDVYFEKETPLKKATGKTIGIDIGYKKLLASSDGRIYGRELEDLYKKISGKKRGSKAYKRLLKHRDTETRRVVKQLPLNVVKAIILEDLRGLKKRNKGTLRKSFVNRLQYWRYRDVLNLLVHLSEEIGFTLKRVNPSYTSQKCSACGAVCKSSRQGEVYICPCGIEMDADINAAINILHLGAYSPQALPVLDGISLKYGTILPEI